MPQNISDVLRQIARTSRNCVRYVWQDRWMFASRPIVAAARLRHRFEWQGVSPGTTVLIANWQTRRFLETTIAQVIKHSPASTRIIIVDNASTDGSREYLRTLGPEVRVIRLPTNVGHGVALDLAAVFARTRFIVALDADAFPISSTWIETLSAPLLGEKAVSGALASNGDIAPCCLMIERSRFLRRHHTFTSRMVPGNDPWLSPDRAWDVGRGISAKEGTDSLHGIPRSAYVDEFLRVGEIFGDVVYHNGYATVDLSPAARGVTSKLDALEVWAAAEIQFGAVR